MPCPTLYRMPDHASSESQSLETILQSVHSCLFRPGFGHDSQGSASSRTSPMGLELQALFWNTIKQGINLLKISAFERAFPVLRKTVELASGAFAESPMAFVQELFSTLSPVNATVCAEIRLSRLRGFVVLAGQRFGSTHSVTVICSELQKDRTSRWIKTNGIKLQKCVSQLLDNRLLLVKGLRLSIMTNMQYISWRILPRYTKTLGSQNHA